MAIKPVLQYRNPDSTFDLNSSQAQIVDRAIFDGGTLSLSGTSLQVTVAPFIAAGYDGMVAISDVSETVTVPSTGTYYLVLHLEYRVLTSPIVNLIVVPESLWTSSVSKNFFVTFAKFVMTGAVTMLDPAVVVDYSVGDWADKLGKTGWRSPVASSALLPTLGNRDGDTRLTLDTYTSYAWQAGTSTWTVVGGALDLGEVVARAHEMDAEELRAFNGSGYVGSLNVDPTGATHNGTYDRIPYVTVASADRLDLDAMHFVVNGHFVKTPYTELALDAKPPVGERHDLVYLDVWREKLVTAPAVETYTNDPSTGGTSSFLQLRDRLEQLLENSPFPNSGFSKIEAVDATTFVVIRWALRVASFVNPSAVTTPSIVATSGLAFNVDGAPFGVLDPSDKRLWTASSAVTPFDGVSWGIPLLVVRRTSLEAGISGFVTETRADTKGTRFLFDVAPRAELGKGIDETIQSLVEVGASQEAIPSPSGFISGSGAPFDLSVSSFLGIPESKVIVASEVLRISPSSVPLTPASASSGTHQFDLVTLEVQSTANPPSGTSAVGTMKVRRVAEAGIRGKRSYGKFVVTPLTTNVPTEALAMSSASYVADPSDPGLWTRPAVVGVEDVSKLRAIPIALIVRRNTGTWSFSSAPGRQGSDRSGFPGMPNNSADLLYPGEVLDLRHLVADISDAPQLMEESYSKLLTGELSTRFGADAGGDGVSSFSYGTEIIQVDQIGTPTVGAHTVSPAPDGRTCVWSDADEAQLLSYSFLDLSVPHDSGELPPTFDWVSTGAYSGNFTVKAPSGMHLDFGQGSSSVPASPGEFFLSAYIPLAAAASDQELRGPTSTGAISVTIDGAGNINSITVNAVDFTGFVGAGAGVAAVAQVWAVKPSTVTASIYSGNGSLYSTPSVVHRAEVVGGKRLNIGPLVKTVRVPIDPISHIAVVNQASVFSVFPEIASNASSVSIVGASSVFLVGGSLLDGAGSYLLRSVQLTSGAGFPGFSDMTLTFAAAVTATEVDVQVMCHGNLIDSWIEINPSSRGVRGVYSWFQTELTSPDATARSIVVSLPGGSHLVPFYEVGLSPLGMSWLGGGSSNTLSAGTTSMSVYGVSGTAYTLWTDPADQVGLGGFTTVGPVGINTSQSGNRLGPWSSFVCLRFPATNAGVSLLSAGVIRTPLALGARVRVFYSYAPYQGLSSDTPVVSDMSSYLHGTVGAVGGSIITSSGPNTPAVHPREVSTWYRNSDPYVPFSSAGDDSGFTGASGIDFNVTRSSSKTWFVRGDNESFINPEDIPFASSLYHLPAPSTVAFVETLRGAGVSMGEPFFAHDAPMPLPSGYAEAGSSWVFNSAGGDVWRTGNPGNLDLPVVVSDSDTHIADVTVSLSSLVSGASVVVSVIRQDPVLSVASATFVTSSTAASYVLQVQANVAQGSSYFVRITAPGTTSVFLHSANARILRGSLGVLSPLPFGTTSHLVPSLLSIYPGQKLELSYSAADFTDWLSVYVKQAIRGLQFRTNSLLGDRNLFDGASFLPNPSFALADLDPSLGAFTSSGLPRSLTGTVPRLGFRKALAVSTPVTASTSYPSSVASLDHWMVRTLRNEAFMGASTSLVPASAHTSVRSATTVDAFYPVGRPLFRKTK